MKSDGPLRIEIITVFLTLAAALDLNKSKIPNWLNMAGFGIGMLLLIQNFSLENLRGYLFVMLILIMILWLPFRMHGLGAGDVKLCIATGCLMGSTFDAVLCIFFSFLLAAGFSLGKLLSHRQLISSLNFFIQYILDMQASGKVSPYPLEKHSDHQIHMAVAVFGGFGLWMGVKLCRIIL